MPELELIGYGFFFVLLYAQVFLLLTFSSGKDKVSRKTLVEKYKPVLKVFPTIDVIVPAWNEEDSIDKTIDSLLCANYPKDKLKIVVVNDGSTDNTWGVMQKYKKNPQVAIYDKENGGKHTALNLGITESKAEFVACLDADCEIDPDIFLWIIDRLQKDKNISAVIPSALVKKTDTLLRKFQRIEYILSIFQKKVFSMMGALHVTPGTLPVYRREIFEKIGLFEKAHNGEDMEMAFRMQVNQLKIIQAHEAIVYTITPPNIKTLIKQRVRWTYAFINIMVDYRKALFNRKFGYFGFFTMPASGMAIIAVLYLFWFGFVLGNLNKGVHFAKQIWYSGFGSIGFSWWSINLSIYFLLLILMLLIMFYTVLSGRKLSDDRPIHIPTLIGFVTLFVLLTPIWISKSFWRTISGRRQISWR